jgi:hypothetical protein
VPRNADGSFEAEALIKVRLGHAQHGSILLPDHILVCDGTRFWLQPQWISPPILHFAETNSAIFYVAVANKIGADPLVKVRFDEDGFVADLPDRSQLYAGRVAAPIDVTPFRSGRWRERDDGGVDLRLYHHTTAANKKSILASGEVWGSAWNFQGNKRLRNVSYAYFTSLDRIADRDDLKRIAMAHDGHLAFRLDQSPANAGPDLVLDVYRESTENRTARIGLWVPAEHIAPSHVWKHTTAQVEYEVTHPWIYRVGLAPGGRYAFERDTAALTQTGLKHFEYLVLGDCTTQSGLAAPYDEEDTSETVLIQSLTGETVFGFWRRNANEALWRDDVERQEFGGPT